MILGVIKRAARNIGIDPKTIWTHLLRKSFRKVLSKAPIDSDMVEAIMGHRIKGNKENYFDRHDLDWIASEYKKAPFSREGIGRLNHLEKQLKEKEETMLHQEERIKSLSEDKIVWKKVEPKKKMDKT